MQPQADWATAQGVNYPIYDPTTLASCTAHSTNGPCRYQYGYGPGASSGPAGNPIVVSPGKVNVIPASELSPISQYQQSFLPDPTITTTGTIQNNYLGGIPSGYDNWLYSGRIDYNISERQTLSFAITGATVTLFRIRRRPPICQCLTLPRRSPSSLATGPTCSIHLRSLRTSSTSSNMAS